MVKLIIHHIWVASIVAVLTALFATSSYSADFRAEDKGEFARMVFDYGTSVPYDVSAVEGGEFTLTIQSAEDLAGLDAFNQSKARLISSNIEGDTATFGFRVSNGADIRHFATSSRIFIDVYGENLSASEAGNSVTETDTSRQNPDRQETAPDTSESSADTQEQARPSQDVTLSEQAEATATTQSSIEDFTNPFVITLSSTASINVAGFKRGNELWFVIDQPDFAVPPQLSRENNTGLGNFRRIELPEATAFVAPMSESLMNTFIYTEGGGLVWRFIVTDVPRDVENLALQRAQYNRQDFLTWPSENAAKVLNFDDPETGLPLYVVTVRSAEDSVTPAQSFVQMDVYNSFAGLGILSLADALAKRITEDKVWIRVENGETILSPIEDYTLQGLDTPVLQPSDDDVDLGDLTEEIESDGTKPIFRFDRWQKGGDARLRENERILLRATSREENENRPDELMAMAKLELANNRGIEALGLLRYANQIMPELEDTPEYQALHGAAATLAKHYDTAFSSFLKSGLMQNPEIQAWQAVSLAGLEDWNQAGETLPPETDFVANYPFPVRHIQALAMSEIALRAGKSGQAADLLEIAEQDREEMAGNDAAFYDYLQGELYRQEGRMDEAVEIWKPLTTGTDDLHRAKAGLAYTRLLYDNNQITAEEATDRLERLRYAWRGDDIETQIYYNLGKIYIENGNIIKGLSIMRIAASRSIDRELAREITQTMTDQFEAAFQPENLSELGPLEAVTLFEDFKELAPTGDEGDALARQLSGRLVDIELLDRAANLLKDQVNNRLGGMQGLQTALDLARIQLTDRKPTEALQTLAKADEFYAEVASSEDNTPATLENLREDISLLRARAYTLENKTQEALNTLSKLNQTPPVIRMRADVAWRAGRWDDAADAMEELVMREDISDTRPFTNEQAEMVLNWAVTLNLSNNRYVLANVRERYSDMMSVTPYAEQFEVITRPRQNIFLADRETIKSIISEVDIFKGFLDEPAETNSSATETN